MNHVQEGAFAQLALAGWQAMLDRHPQIFLGMEPGSRVGLLPEESFDSPSAIMLVWEATERGMVADYRRFPGFAEVEVDLLFVVDSGTLQSLHRPDTEAPFALIKSKVRRREILLYVVKPRDELLDRGYEEFLDSLGLVFMGACR